LKRQKAKLVYWWRWLKVFLGLGVWAEEVRCRPKTAQWCVYCGAYTCKRVRKTEVGAIYQCRKCGQMYHMTGGENKLVAVSR